MTLSTKDPDERIPVTFDLAALCTAVVSPTLAISRDSGPADADPEAMLDGTPIASGATSVVQWVIGGIAGTNYRLRCEFDTSDGKHLVVEALLGVRAARPD